MSEPRGSRFARIRRHLVGIFSTGEGTYLNEDGELVQGKLPRTKLENPLKTICRPTFKNYMFFLVGYLAWTMDGYDFHTVSLSISNLAKYYHKERDQITTSITLTLLFRSLGAAVFGIAGDMYGRKWPMIVNLVFLAALELATAYCDTFPAFLGVRALFGVMMGGIWGLAASMSLENMPIEARGLMSGILQQGYAMGYLLAATLNMTVVPKSRFGFKSLFFIGAALTGAVAISRIFFPESQQFLQRKLNESQMTEAEKKNRAGEFLKEAKKMMKIYWKRAIYAIILMALFNLMSHTSQDLYPTFMKETKGFTQEQASKATILAKCGALVGGTICGYYSQFFGRRATIMCTTLVAAAIIPVWVLPSNWGALVAGAFFLQFMVQGAWGVIPIHLNELSPPQFRSSFPGLAYQLGNLISAPAAQIASIISEKSKIVVDGEERPNYGKTQAIMMAVIFLVLCFWTACGEELRGSHFELAGAAGDNAMLGKEIRLEDRQRLSYEDEDEERDSHNARPGI